ncbi:MAG TPA: hypothetical protein VKR58_11415, partial [Aquella sp.]|nr:hypothetical protein [Aquella sp.]
MTIKKLPSLSTIIFICIASWLCILLIHTFNLKNAAWVDNICEQSDLIINVITIVLSYVIYKNSKNVNKKIFFWLLLSSIFLLINELSFYLVVYIPGNLVKAMPLITLIPDMLLGYIVHLSIIIFLILPLITYVINRKQFIKITLLLSVYSILIIILFLQQVKYSSQLEYWQDILIVILFF